MEWQIMDPHLELRRMHLVGQWCKGVAYIEKMFDIRHVNHTRQRNQAWVAQLQENEGFSINMH